jgi:hypothetical protein
MRKYCLLFVIILFTVSCQKEPKQSYNLSGYAQKGPFLMGSEVTIIELDDGLDPTGKVFFSTIEDNFGYFSFPDVEFRSNYVQLKVEGEYYNEVTGGVNSLSEIILQSIVDISDNSTININIITHLVQARTLQLVNNGIDYSSAYEQAYHELLTIFCIADSDFIKPETLNLCVSDVNGGILLLVSSIIQSNIGSGLIFSEFLTLLTNDFKDNGLIDNELIQKTIGTSGLVLNIDDIIDNLTGRYAELGQAIEPYEGKQFLNNFKLSNSYSTIFDTAFPATIEAYQNLVNREDSVIIDQSKSYAIAIKGSNDSDISNIQIRITSNTDNFSTSGIDWYVEDNRKIYLMDYDGTDLIIPIEFNESGELELELFIVTRSSSMVAYPKINVSWE